MPLPASVAQFVGEWSGPTRLHQSWLEGDDKIQESRSHLKFAVDRNSNVAILTYDWQHDGQPQDAVLILACSESGELMASWTDSWHMKGSLLHLKGQFEDGKPVVLLGKYQMEGYPEWGWSIYFDGDTNEMRFGMDNIDPDGNAEWAVQAVYTKATQ